MKLKLSTIEKIRPEGPGPKEYRWGITKAIIRNMKTVCDDLGAKFLVYGIHRWHRSSSLLFIDAFESAMKELGLNYLESFEDFYKVSQGKEIFVLARYHWNARGMIWRRNHFTNISGAKHGYEFQDSFSTLGRKDLVEVFAEAC